MDFKIPNRVAMAVCAVLVGAVGLVACKGTGYVEITGNFVGASGHFRAGYDGHDVNINQTPARVDVKFFDAGGNPLGQGATGVGAGDKVPVPAGASIVEFSGPSEHTSCTGCTTGGGGGGGGAMADVSNDTSCTRDMAMQGPAAPNSLVHREAMPIVQKFVLVQTLDADVDGSTVFKNVDAEFLVTCPIHTTAAQLHAQIEAILLGGAGTAVPSSVEVGRFVQLIPELLGGRLIVADETQGFSSLSLVWNRVTGYATLNHNSRCYDADNGWKVAEVFVPTTDFSINGLASSNSLNLQWQTAEDQALNSIDAAVSYW